MCSFGFPRRQLQLHSRKDNIQRQIKPKHTRFRIRKDEKTYLRDEILLTNHPPGLIERVKTQHKSKQPNNSIR